MFSAQISGDARIPYPLRLKQYDNRFSWGFTYRVRYRKQVVLNQFKNYGVTDRKKWKRQNKQTQFEEFRVTLLSILKVVIPVFSRPKACVEENNRIMRKIPESRLGHPEE